MSEINEWQIDRRSALSLIAAGLAAAIGVARAADPPEQSALEIGAVRDLQGGIQIAIALTKNYFKDEGLDVKIRWVQQAGDLYPMLASSALNLAGLGVHALMILRARKVQARAICALCEYAGSQGLVLRPGLKLAGPSDLVGKRIAAPSTSPLELALLKFAKQHGFDASKVTLVKMEPAESIIALGKGDVDGALTYQPHLYKMTQMGGTLYWTGTHSYMTGKKVAFAPDERLLYIHSTLVVNDQWLAANPKTTAAVLRAMVRADALIKTHQAEVETILQDLFRVDAEAVKQALAQNIYGLALDEDVLRSARFANDWLVSNKRIPEPQNPADLVATTFLQQLNPRLVNWRT